MSPGLTNATPAGAVLALLAALSWGGGDFAGGMGSKAAGGSVSGTLRMMIAAHAISLAVMVAVLLASGGARLQGVPVAWGLGCGVVAGLSLAAFYIALATGTMGASAALSGLLAAAIPAAVGIALEGRPTLLRSLGFALAAGAIWMIAAPSPEQGQTASSGSSKTTWLAIAGGVGFGLYFAGLKFANPLGVVEPMALARVGSILASVLLLAALRGGSKRESPGAGWLTRAGWLWALGVAVLDTGGNLLYIAATRAGRLDVAAVLASLYPATTILLAAGLLKERPGRRQLVGMGVAAAAVVLVTI